MVRPFLPTTLFLTTMLKLLNFVYPAPGFFEILRQTEFTTNTCILYKTYKQDKNIANLFLAPRTCSFPCSLYSLTFKSHLSLSLVTAVYRSHLQDPFLLGFKKEGDEKFQAQRYEEAAAFYTFALNYPALPFMDTSAIAEKLFRKRAVCFYKMVSLSL